METTLEQKMRREFEEVLFKYSSEILVSDGAPGEHMESSIISRLPENISQADLYKPRMVSIGPYYHSDNYNSHKWRFLESFLSRSSESLVNYIEEVVSLKRDARKCYSANFSLDQFEFVEMLLLDGCFILELFFKWLNEDPDVLFTESWGLRMILSDLLLIENQIPFFVIERLFHKVMAGEAKNRRNAFLNLLARFLMNDQEPSHTSLEIWPEKIYHLLHLYHYFLIVPNLSQEGKKEGEKYEQTTSPLWKQRLTEWSLDPTAQRPTQWSPTADQWGAKRPPRQIPGAVELYEAGVKFKRNSSFKNLFDVKFGRGILEIPPLQIDSIKKIILANLVALERDKSWGDHTVTSYAALMDSLINTKEDVTLLQHAGVIHNKLSSHQEAAVFFNQLGDYFSIDNVNPYFVELFKNVQLYYDSSWNQSRARLMHDYFSSPWAIISVIAGVILLSLTIVQTFFTVYPYYRPSS
ncbi:hypothetical protein LUZ63_009434 [Rhynchospora breviuscula]|uniref:Uncharacterized protein n=1 Tax=Rhynchospora breviuscula TaxID=2022672 RepID=A0A9Q0CF32_9POAL|nr:hypothetical protein LUZ63_009434 [Rhynchospora breviuscula]